jgi:predicted thioesterase
MEFAAYQVLEPYYDKQETSVGVRVEVHHLAPTPVGMRFRAKARLTRIDGRRIFFDLEAYDEKEQIGRGTNERFIIDIDRFRDRLERKLT